MDKPPQAGRFSAGFTLIEIIVVIGILLILAVVSIAAYAPLLARAEAAACVSNMKSLQISLAAYMQDQGHWPQEPDLGDQDAYEDWWILEMAPYGATEKMWRCPTIQRLVVGKSGDGRPKVHYTPTMFDAHLMTPYRYPNQPWLIENGDMHGNGGHLCFPDGSIRSMDEVLNSQ